MARRTSIRRMRGGRYSRLRHISNIIRTHFKTAIILAIVLVTIISVISISNIVKDTTRNIEEPGIAGIAKIDGYKFGVFDTTDEAIEHTIANMPAGIKKIEISNTTKKIDVSTSIFNSLVTKAEKNVFLLDLTNVINNEPIVVTISIGGDGSLVSRYLDDDVKFYYFAVSVCGNESEATSQIENTNVPNVSAISFNGNSIKTSSTFEEAETIAINNRITLSESDSDLTISAIPNENTARVVIKISRIDREATNHGWVRLGAENNWTGQMSLTDLAGHFVTMMIKDEDWSARYNRYQYISFYISSENTKMTTET